MSREGIPTAELRAAVLEYVKGGSVNVVDPRTGKVKGQQESTIGGWSRIAELLEYDDPMVCRDSVRKMLSRDVIPTRDKLGRDIRAWTTAQDRFDPFVLVDRICVAINRPDLAAALLPVDEEENGDVYKDALRWCICCGTFLEAPDGWITSGLLSRQEAKDAGAEHLPTRHHRWRACGPCITKVRPEKVIRTGPGCRSRKVPTEEVTRLYIRYAREPITTIQMVVDEDVVGRYGYASVTAAAAGLDRFWLRAGWPMRTRRWGKSAHHEYERRHGDFGRWTARELKKLHVLHTRGKRMSVLGLSRQLYEKKGYKTPSSCQAAILMGWKRLGLKARDRIEMTVEMTKTNGRSPRNWQDRKRLRQQFDREEKEAGRVGINSHGRPRQPICIATSKTTKLRCDRPAKTGMSYCPSHDPERQATISAHLAAMRANSPTHNQEFVSWEPVLAALDAALAAGFTWEELGEACGLKGQTLKTYRSPSRQGRLGKARADRWLEGIARLTDPLQLAEPLEPMPLAA